MFICILAIGLLVLVAALGYLQGAVGLLISLSGLFLGAALAFPLAPLTTKLVVWMGVKHPVWSWVWPPVFAFLIVYLLFNGLAAFVHFKLRMYYKYRADDRALFQWERLNKRLGACLGLVMGAFWFLLIGMMIHVAGYLSVQVAPDDTGPSWLRYLNKAKRDLRSTGLERSVAAFDPVPAAYYQVSDILGLLYQNPILISRLAKYPPFLTTGERQEFQDMASDKDYMNMLLTKADVTQIVSNPKTQAIIYNQEIVQELLGQDLTDLRKYLETGISPKYEDEKILGVWQLDLYTTVAQVRKKHPNISATEMRKLREIMAKMLPGVSIKATTDNKVTLKAPGVEAARQAAEAARQAAQAAQAAREQAGGGPTGMSPELARRYGLVPSGGARSMPQGRPQAPQPVAPAPTPAVAEPPAIVSPGQGSWRRDGDKYELRLPGEKGRETRLQATAEEDRLTVQTPMATLVFFRVD